jgi:hypothetical protein
MATLPARILVVDFELGDLGLQLTGAISASCQLADRRAAASEV